MIQQHLVRVQVRQADGSYRTLAQLEEPHARQYIQDIQSDLFDAAMMNNINADKTPLQEKANGVRELKTLIDNATFSESFRIIPMWQEGMTQ